MTREEKQKAIDALKISAPVSVVTQEEFDDYIQTLNQVMNWLEQEPKTWSLDDAREDFMHDVYNTLDFLPTNDEANQIIESFDRVTSSIKQQPCEVEAAKLQQAYNKGFEDCRQAAIDVMSNALERVFPEHRDIAEKAMNKLPPVTSQPKTGHWEYVQYDYNPKLGNWHCSECRCVVVECVNKEEKGGIPLYKYCPQCGAKMQAESNIKQDLNYADEDTLMSAT